MSQHKHTEDRYQKILSLLKSGLSGTQIAKQLGVSNATVSIYKQEAIIRGDLPGKLRNEKPSRLGKPKVEPAPTSAAAKTEIAEEGGKDSKTYTSKSTKIKTVDDLLDYAKVDLTKWEVERFIVNKWDMGYTTTTGDTGAKVGATEPLYQVKVWLKKLSAEQVAISDIFKDLLEQVKKYAPTPPKPYRPVFPQGGHLLEINIPDLHLGKLCWKEETGSEYNSTIARREFFAAIHDTLNKSMNYDVERILFPIGNDYFNTDNLNNETTAGTRQDVDTRWGKMFQDGWKMLVEAIDLLRLIAPVDVIVVPGNHDAQRTRILGEVLDAWYRNDTEVHVNNSFTERKYYHWKNTLIGLTHGDKTSQNDLPNIMAHEVPELWAKSKFREWHLGHLHGSHKTAYSYQKELRSTKVKVFPSLSGTDAWHAGKGYDNAKSAESLLWSEKGLENIFVYTSQS